MEPKLQIRLAQKLALAPQLQQAIRLLQLNRIELREYIQEVLDANPLLERDEGDSPGEGPDLEQPAEAGSLAEDAATDWEMDTLPGEQWTETPSYEGYSGEAQIADSSEGGLLDHLLWQINLAHFSDVDSAIAQAIIRAAESVFGQVPFVQGVTAEGTIISHVPMPTVLTGFGPIKANLHAPTDNITVADYIRRIKYAATIMEEYGREAE